MQTGRIYKIVGGALENQKVYIGATTKPLEQRLIKHKNNFKSWKKTGKNGVSVFEIFNAFGPENCKIELIQEIQFDNVKQLREAESLAIRNTPNAVNQRVEARTPEEKAMLSKQHHKNTNFKAQKKYFQSVNGRQKLREAVRRYSSRPDVKERRRAQYQMKKAEVASQTHQEAEKPKEMII